MREHSPAPLVQDLTTGTQSNTTVHIPVEPQPIQHPAPPLQLIEQQPGPRFQWEAFGSAAKDHNNRLRDRRARQGQHPQAPYPVQQPQDKEAQPANTQPTVTLFEPIDYNGWNITPSYHYSELPSSSNPEDQYWYDRTQCYKQHLFDTIANSRDWELKYRRMHMGSSCSRDCRQCDNTN